MERQFITAPLIAALLAAAIAACGQPEEKEAALPAMLKARFQTEMKIILHELKAAEESAAVLEGEYLELSKLEGRYFTRPVPETYELSVSELSPTSFRARIVHGASGLSCRLEVGTGQGQGVPICD